MAALGDAVAHPAPDIGSVCLNEDHGDVEATVAGITTSMKPTCDQRSSEAPSVPGALDDTGLGFPR
jgi:hypothetical protein